MMDSIVQGLEICGQALGQFPERATGRVLGQLLQHWLQVVRLHFRLEAEENTPCAVNEKLGKVPGNVVPQYWIPKAFPFGELGRVWIGTALLKKLGKCKNVLGVFSLLFCILSIIFVQICCFSLLYLCQPVYRPVCLFVYFC